MSFDIDVWSVYFTQVKKRKDGAIETDTLIVDKGRQKENVQSMFNLNVQPLCLMFLGECSSLAVWMMSLETSSTLIGRMLVSCCR